MVKQTPITASAQKVKGSRRARTLAGLTTKKTNPKPKRVSQVLKGMSSAALRNRVLKGILKRPARTTMQLKLRKKGAPRVKWADRLIQGEVPMGKLQFEELIPHVKIAADPVLPKQPKLDTPKIEAMFEEV